MYTVNSLPSVAGIPALLALASAFLIGSESNSAQSVDDAVYAVRYTVTPVPDKGGAIVEMRVRQSRHMLREMSMAFPAARFKDATGDGELVSEDGRLQWRPPAGGGAIRWFAVINHRRDTERYDSYLDDDWALFRATDILPAARTRTAKGARSQTSLKFVLPDGWSSVTQYFGKSDLYPVENDARRFDRPTGWMLLGHIGTRTETIAGTMIKISAPVGQSVRRLDILALLHWTMPYMTRLIPDFPKRLTIISASAGMWRGGLSGPRSLFIHADLPLISENATSTILHEVIHVAAGIRSGKNADWIVEGLAEYYGLEILRRSRTISEERYKDAIAGLRKWGNTSGTLCTRQSTGATTAKAVAIFADLDLELRRGSSGRTGLDQLLALLVEADAPISVTDLRTAAARLHGGTIETLKASKLPGCTL